ncbi:CP family cyanate transporter-like MFS transporter [Kroppenstedtia sanguinis]|uniref:CynX/NimT family MFS transporter n=1 Tax=Kroppenstedtia sanguinis TaxID=1380684 RepID=A0ABW4CG96_9BACL
MTNHSLTATENIFRGKTALFIIGMIWVAFNLRPAITSVGPLVGDIRQDLGISNGMAGWLTTLPVLSFAIFSLVAPKIGNRLGNEKTVFLGLLILTCGIVIRSSGPIIAVFAGTALIGVGVAINNVLLPGIVKHRFPEKTGMMTSIYSTSMGLFAAIASGVSIPLSQGLHLGWRRTLVLWGIIGVIALILWATQLGKKNPPDLPSSDTTSTPLWRSPLAWQVSFFMGLQSFLFYCMIAWLPEILSSQGMSRSMAGWMLFGVQFIGLPATFLAPVLADRFSHQRGIVGGISILYFVGLLGLFASGNLAIAILSVISIGLGQGASISLSLTMLSLRANHAKQAAALSGMAQSFGYLLAAIGPILTGFLYDTTHSWTLPILTFLIITLLMLLAGLGAGRNVTVFHEN